MKEEVREYYKLNNHHEHETKISKSVGIKTTNIIFFRYKEKTIATEINNFSNY